MKMSDEERQFCIDLIKALDIGLGNTQTSQDYDAELHGETKRQALRTVKFLIDQGYKKC